MYGEDPTIAISTRGVTKEFGQGDARALVLRGVNLDVRRGGMTLLVGPSGSGKTTLLSVIAGLLDATGGEVNVLGVNLAGLSNGDKVRFRRRNLGFVFQQFNLLPALTAAENVTVPLLTAGVVRKTALAKARILLGRLGMSARADALPSQLSGGEQQRVALARALIHEPQLIVCDEPTSALDAETGQTVMSLLASVAVQPERAVLVVTHDSRIYRFADAIAYMDDGRILRVESGQQDVSASAQGAGKDGYQDRSTAGSIGDVGFRGHIGRQLQAV